MTCAMKRLLVWQISRWPRDTAPGRRVPAAIEEAVCRTAAAEPCLSAPLAGTTDRPGLCGAIRRPRAIQQVTREVLPWVCAARPMRYYLPSSPYIPSIERRPKGPSAIWGPRDDFRLLPAQHRPFASEIGYHGCPAVSSLRHSCRPELWPMEESRVARPHRASRTPELRPQRAHGQTGGDALEKRPGVCGLAFASRYSQAEQRNSYQAVPHEKWDKTRFSGGTCWTDGPRYPTRSSIIIFTRSALSYHIAQSAPCTAWTNTATGATTYGH